MRSVAVQGVAAVPEVTAAIRELDALDDVDVIVIARGGGSVEDLLPFSNEDLVRTAALAATPIVSAIGHERDHPLLDDVADFRASTPTDAARRIVPDLAEEQARLDRLRQAMRTQLTAGINDEHRRIESLRRSGALAQAINRIPAEQELLQRTRRDARRAVEALLAGASERLDGLQHRLHALSPRRPWNGVRHRRERRRQHCPRAGRRRARLAVPGPPLWRLVHRRATVDRHRHRSVTAMTETTPMRSPSRRRATSSPR